MMRHETFTSAKSAGVKVGFENDAPKNFYLSQVRWGEGWVWKCIIMRHDTFCELRILGLHVENNGSLRPLVYTERNGKQTINNTLYQSWACDNAATI